MKRLTKVQKEIEGLAPTVPQLTDAQIKWAISQFTYFRVLNPKTHTCICPECKEKVDVPKSHKMDKTIRCPHCGARIRIRTYADATSNRNNHQEAFFQVMSIVGKWQVSRLIYMQRYCYIRKENTPWEFYEVCQGWNNPETANTYFRSFPKICLPAYHFNPYAIHTWRYEHNADEDTYHIYPDGVNELEPRRVNGANYFDSNRLYPRSQILPYYKKRGLTAKSLSAVKHNSMWLFEGCNNGEYRAMYETLLKSGEYALFQRLMEYPHRLYKTEIFTAWKICRRNGYTNYRRNLGEWLDLVQLVITNGCDYHSPHYVCPASIHDMHQRMLAVKERNEEMAELQRAKDNNKDYCKRIARYLGMEIRDDFLTIVVLPNVESFKEEADHLHHCVYRCAYYNKVDSLLLSARDDSGKRWETIEVSLKSFKILQSYGYGDKHTERHQEILDLVNNNMWQIRKCKKMKVAC